VTETKKKANTQPRVPKREKQEAVAKAVQAAMEKQGLTTMRLGGKVVKLCRVPPLLIQQLNDQFAEPDPPMVEVEVGGRKESRPNLKDRGYLKELEAVREEKGLAFLKVALIFGLKFEMPEGSGWLEDLKAVGMKVGDSEAERRLAYIESVLITDISQMTEVTTRILAMSGVTP
jgi:hypothetical protein